MRNLSVTLNNRISIGVMLSNAGYQTLLNLFRSTGGQVGVGRVGTDYYLYTPANTGMVFSTYLKSVTTLGKTCHQIQGMTLRIAAVSVAHTDGSVVKGGAGTWTGGTNAGAYTGTYALNATEGATLTITTPDGTTKFGLRMVKSGNAGLSTVSIDSDLTRASVLPTAQDVVDAGYYPATILTTGGGTLDPTTRVLDQYDAATLYDEHLVFATDLTGGIHTVVITSTVYKRDAATDNRLYISGYAYATASTAMTDAGVTMLIAKKLGRSGSVYEYAMTVNPTGGSGAATIGNGHGYDNQTDITITLDGSTVTPADGETLAGSTLIITRTSVLNHPNLNAGATQVGHVTQTYTADPYYGLQIAWSITWDVGGTNSTAYVSMLPLDTTTMLWASNFAQHTAVTLTANDNSFVANARSKAVTAWELTQHFSILDYTPDLTKNVNNWASNSPRAFGVEDAVGGTNKIYQYRVYPPATETYQVNDIWQGETWYMAKFSPTVLTVP